MHTFEAPMTTMIGAVNAAEFNIHAFNCRVAHLEIIFQEQSYSTLQLGRNLARDHIRGVITDTRVGDSMVTDAVITNLHATLKTL